jgi:hypothetical protein
MAYKLAVDDKVGLKIKCTTVDKSGRKKNSRSCSSATVSIRTR